MTQTVEQVRHQLCPKCLTSFQVRTGKMCKPEDKIKCECRELDQFVMDQHLAVCEGRKQKEECSA